MSTVDKIFFLHIPKTAGSAFNRMFKDAVPEGRYFEHMESRAHLVDAVVEDEQPLFLSGHFAFPFAEKLVARPDVYSITILRDPMAQLISHIKWVKAYGDPRYPGRKKTIPAAIVKIAEQLWDIPLNDVDAMEPILSSKTGRRLFDNLQTRYLSRASVDRVDAGQVRKAVENACLFNLAFALEDMDDAVDFLRGIFPGIGVIEKINEARLDENIDLANDNLRDFYQKYIEHDVALYKIIQKYSKEKFFPNSSSRKRSSGRRALLQPPQLQAQHEPVLLRQPRLEEYSRAYLTPRRLNGKSEFSGEIYTEDRQLVDLSLRPSAKAAFTHVPKRPGDAELRDCANLPGRYLYVGHVFEMFGHELLEFSTRLWPLVAGCRRSTASSPTAGARKAVRLKSYTANPSAQSCG